MRGGGLYAVGYALTFVFLEVRTIVSEIAGAESIGIVPGEKFADNYRQLVAL